MTRKRSFDDDILYCRACNACYHIKSGHSCHIGRDEADAKVRAEVTMRVDDARRTLAMYGSQRERTHYKHFSEGER